MGNTNYYQAGRNAALATFQKTALIGAAIGAMKAKEMNPKDPQLFPGAIAGELGGMGGGMLGQVAGAVGGGLAGTAAGIPLSLLLKKPELLMQLAGAGATVGGIGGGIAGFVHGARRLPEAVLKDTRKPKK